MIASVTPAPPSVRPADTGPPQQRRKRLLHLHLRIDSERDSEQLRRNTPTPTSTPKINDSDEKKRVSKYPNGCCWMQKGAVPDAKKRVAGERWSCNCRNLDESRRKGVLFEFVSMNQDLSRGLLKQ
jgi:hypothetical protein